MERLEITEAVTLGVVRLLIDQRGQQLGKMDRVHLPIAIDLDDQIGVEFERLAKTGDHGAAHTLVLFVPEQEKPGIVFCSRLHDPGSTVGRGIVHKNNVC